MQRSVLYLSNHMSLSFCILLTNEQACGEFGKYAIILCSHNLLIKKVKKRKENSLYLFTNSRSRFAVDKAHINLIISQVLIV